MDDISEQENRNDDNEQLQVPPEGINEFSSERQLTDEEKRFRQIIVDWHRLRARRRIAARSITARHMGSMIYYRPDNIPDRSHSGNDD